MGFSATVNVELAVASLQETVTVTGDSPVIDTSNTRVQQNFKLEALQEIPNSRDLWSLLAVTPSVTMGRIDVGGNRAGTQTGYTAYGYSGQNRVLVEGINTTEGTAGAGFYVDYGSFEEVFLGTVGQGAEMPTPGVQSQMLGKSGGNKFQGEFYQDYETNGMIGENIEKNIPSKFLFGPTNSGGIRLHSNETAKYRDSNINVGGPIRKDRVWWYFWYRNQKTSVGQPNFIGDIAGTNFDTKLWNPSGKTTYQINQNNKLIGYYQWGQKVQPNRLPQSSLNYTSLDGTLKQISGSWIYKGEWNGTLNNKTYVEARYGVFGYYFPLLANSDTTAHEVFDNSRSLLLGADQKEQTDRQRRQATGSMTYFKDGWGGSHNFKVGGELMLETGWYGFQQVASGNIRETIASSGAPSQVQMYAPTALQVGNLGDGPNGNLLSVAKVNTIDWFVTDQWTVGRATLNLGVRYDHYDVFTPDQSQLAYTFPSGVSIPATSFAEQHYVKWGSFVPRLGMTYDLLGTGKTVLKANYGMYRFNPGVGVAASANSNQSSKSITYQWLDNKVCATCIPGDKIYQPGEEGAQTAQALAGNISVDPEHRAAALAPGDVLRRAAGVGGCRRPRRFCLLQREEPDRHVPAAATGQRLHGALYGGGCRRGRRPRDGRRPEPDGVWHSECDVRQLQDEPGRAELARQRRVQDHRSVAEQAPEPQLLAGRRLGLHMAARLSLRCTEHAERAGGLRLLDLLVQGERHLQRAVRHPAERRVPVSGGSELRPARLGVRTGVVRVRVQRGGRRPRQLRDRQPFGGRHLRDPLRRVPPGQHLGGRSARREDRQAGRRREGPPVPRRLQPDERVRGRNDRQHGWTDVPAADGDSRTRTARVGFRFIW